MGEVRPTLYHELYAGTVGRCGVPSLHSTPRDVQHPCNGSTHHRHQTQVGTRTREPSPSHAHHQILLSPQLDPLCGVKGVGVSSLLCLQALDLPCIDSIATGEASGVVIVDRSKSEISPCTQMSN